LHSTVRLPLSLLPCARNSAQQTQISKSANRLTPDIRRVSAAQRARTNIQFVPITGYFLFITMHQVEGMTRVCVRLSMQQQQQQHLSRLQPTITVLFYGKHSCRRHHPDEAIEPTDQ
jgi:cell division protein FtsB